MSVWEGAEDLSTSSRNKVYFTDYFPHISLIWGKNKEKKKKNKTLFFQTKSNRRYVSCAFVQIREISNEVAMK